MKQFTTPAKQLSYALRKKINKIKEILNAHDNKNASTRIFYCLLIIAVCLILFIIKVPELHYKLTIKGEIWTIMEAFGTVGATILSLYLALKSVYKEKSDTARLVDCWTTTRYAPNDNGTSYTRSTKLHILNESNEPVFNASVNTVIGFRRSFIGPLSAPLPISVVPPHQELIYDITTPLLSYPDTSDPRATIAFFDAHHNH